MPSKIISQANKYFNIVIVRLDRTIQNLLKRLDSPIKSGNDKHIDINMFVCRRNSCNKGLTLVEVMIALSVFLLVFMGLFQTALLSVEHNMKNILRDEAVNIAAARMEEARSMPFENVATNPNVCSVSNNLCTADEECCLEKDDCTETCVTPTTVTLSSCATTTYPILASRNFRNISNFPFGTEITVTDFVNAAGDIDTKQITVEVAWEYKNECYIHSVTSLRRR